MVQSAVRRHSAFLKRLIGLFIGLMMGRGAIFILQTWLMAGGRISTTASFGFGFAMLSLIEWTADWGGMVLQSRIGCNGTTFDHFWEASLARELVAPVIIACLVAFAYGYRGTDPLAAGIIAGGALIPPIWAFNLSGYLDSVRKKPDCGSPCGGARHSVRLFMLLVRHTSHGSICQRIDHRRLLRTGIADFCCQPFCYRRQTRSVAAPEHHKRQGSPDEFLGRRRLLCR